MKSKAILSVLLVCLIAFGAQADNFEGRLYVEDATIAPGGTTILSVQLENNIAIRGFNFAFTLPEGITVKDHALSEDRSPAGESIVGDLTRKEDGSYFWSSAFFNDISFSGTSGEIATFTIEAESTVAEANYPVAITGIKVAGTDGTSYQSEDYTFTLTVKTPTYEEGYSVEILPFAFLGTANVSQPIIMANKTAVTNLSFDVEVPSYFTDNNLSRATTVLDDWDFMTKAEISSNIIHVTVDASTGCSIATGKENTIVNFGIRSSSGATAGVYPITIKNIQLTDVDGNTYLAAPYATEIFVGESPKATVTGGVAAFHGNYGGATEYALLKAALPTGATIDLTEVSAMAEDATTLQTDNVIVTADAVAYGRTLPMNGVHFACLSVLKLMTTSSFTKCLEQAAMHCHSKRLLRQLPIPHWSSRLRVRVSPSRSPMMELLMLLLLRPNQTSRLLQVLRTGLSMVRSSKKRSIRAACRHTHSVEASSLGQQAKSM